MQNSWTLWLPSILEVELFPRKLAVVTLPWMTLSTPLSHDLSLHLADGWTKILASLAEGLNRLCKSSAGWVATAVSSTNRKSLKHFALTFVFGRNLARLKSLCGGKHPVLLYQTHFSVGLRKREPNSEGAKTQPA